MSEFDALSNDYRKIKASPYLTARVEAHVNASPSSNLWTKFGLWWPALGAATLVAGAGLMLATHVGETPLATMPDRVVAYTVPGFSQLASSPVTTASLSSPSFANLRSVNSPALPHKPESPVKPLL